MTTQGQARLRKLACKYSQIRLARKCGVSKAVISLWISGGRTPDYDNRKTLLNQLGIDMDAWDTPAEVTK